MNKYYAKPTSMEYFDYTVYYDEDMAKDDNFWAGGNRDFGDINGSLRDDIKNHLENLDSDVETETDSEKTDKENVEGIFNLVHYYFPKSPGRELQYIKLANEFTYCESREENNIICKVLQMEYDEEFINGTITGNSQGDWMEYICPKKIANRVPYIEAVLFATGTEFAITEDKLDLDGKTEDEINQAFDDADKFYDFTELWKEEDIKKWLADMIHCKPEEVEILEGEY